MLKKLAVMATLLAAATTTFAVDAANVAKKFELLDGSTLYVFKDGKMAKEDRYGRAAYLKQGEVLELADGRKIPAVGNEVARLDGLLNDGHRN